MTEAFAWNAAEQDGGARQVEDLVGRTADLVLRVTVLADRYELAEISTGQTARVLALRGAGAQGRSLIISVAGPRWRPKPWMTCL